MSTCRGSISSRIISEMAIKIGSTVSVEAKLELRSNAQNARAKSVFTQSVARFAEISFFR